MAKQRSQPKNTPNDEIDEDSLFDATDESDLDFDDEGTGFNLDDDAGVAGFDPPAPARRERRERRAAPAETFDDRPVRSGRPAAALPAPQPRASAVSTILGVIGTAIFGVILFGLIGAGITAAGRVTGVLPPPAPGVANSSAGYAVVALPSPTPLPAATDEPGCPSATAWWDAQRDTYDRAAGVIIPTYAVLPPGEIQPQIQDLQTRRSAAANIAAANCLGVARGGLLRGIDEVLNASIQAGSGDFSSWPTINANASNGFSELYTALWTHNVRTSDDAPTANGIERLGGADCSAQAWYDGIRPFISDYDTHVQTNNPLEQGGGTLRRLISEMQAQRANIANAAAPPLCAGRAQDVLLRSMDAGIAAFESAGNANVNALRGNLANAARGRYLFEAWVRWLGATV